MFLRAFLLFLAVLLPDCGKIPSDPDKTMEKALGTGLSVGFSHNPPWVADFDSIAGGVEGQLVREFAASFGMNIVWHRGSEQRLMKMLEDKELHIVISGLLKNNPWKSEKIGMTLPYYKTKKEKHVIAIIQGENRLLQQLEIFLNSYKDSINTLIDAYKQEF